MKQLLLVLAFAAALAAGMHFYKKSNSAPVANTGAASGSSCQGKALCGVIYVAPWCPACKQAAPTFKKFLQSSWDHKEHGLEIFVGKGEPQANLEEAITFGRGAAADQSGEKFKVLGIRQYPSFFVQDAQGKILKRDQEALDWIVQNFYPR
jgi:thiol-disulfide isomerase/thioredoxin